MANDSPVANVDELLNALGGTSGVADGLTRSGRKVTLPMVSNWRSRGRIPSGWWSALVELARSKGRADITLEVVERVSEDADGERGMEADDAGASA